MNLWTDLWRLFFPRCCIVCGRTLIRGEEHVCVHCLSALPRTGFHQWIGNRVENLLWGNIPLQRATAWLFYVKEGGVSRLVHALKYYGRKEVGEWMGRMMSMEIQDSGFFEDIDLIIPVPLHKRKKRKRGYNQTEHIAIGIAAVTGLPICADALVKRKSTQSQTRKTRTERKENVQNVFVCPLPERLENKHVLLVDDVLTTGATIAACAGALHGIPGLRISVLTLGIATES